MIIVIPLCNGPLVRYPNYVGRISGVSREFGLMSRPKITIQVNEYILI